MQSKKYQGGRHYRRLKVNSKYRRLAVNLSSPEGDLYRRLKVNLSSPEGDSNVG